MKITTTTIVVVVRPSASYSATSPSATWPISILGRSWLWSRGRVGGLVVDFGGRWSAIVVGDGRRRPASAVDGGGLALVSCVGGDRGGGVLTLPKMKRRRRRRNRRRRRLSLSHACHVAGCDVAQLACSSFVAQGP